MSITVESPTQRRLKGAITVAVRPEMERRLKEIAGQTETSVGGLVRLAVKRFLEDFDRENAR